MKIHQVIFITILLIGFALRIYQFPGSVPFFGDQAWFYLSARDALLSGKFPLLGITSSITWLHQGTLFTYLLIPGFVVSGFNPISGNILMILSSILNIVLIYYLGTLVMSKKAGLVASFIYSVSPLAVINSRIPYHTTPIPLFMVITALLLIKRRSFFSGLFLGFLYSLHLLTFVFWPFALIFVLKNKISIYKFSIGFIISLLPFLLSGPTTWLGIFPWLIYKAFTGFPTSNSPSFYYDQLSKFLSPDLFALVGRVQPGPGSDAYFVLLLIPLTFFTSWLLSKLSLKILFPLLSIIAILNLSYLHRTKYHLETQTYNFSLMDRIDVAKQVVAVSQSAYPNISVVGPGSQFESARDTYKYLVWWQSRLRNPTGKYYKFVVDESNLQIRVIE